jgi:adenylate cyclase
MTTRRLAAILAADVVGFSALMGNDEEGTLARIKSLRREVIEPKVNEHHGRIFKTTGDGVLVEFSSPVEATRCAVGLQEALSGNAAQEGSEGLQLRIGINLGDIIVEDDGDVYGDGVNVAARLEQLADAGGVCVSGKIYEEVRDKLPYHFEDMGEQQVKNIARPVRTYSFVGARAPLSVSAAKPLPLPDKPSIAVLPFTNMSGDPDQEFFGDGMVEDITTALSRVRSFFVTARNSAFAYKGRAVDLEQVGRELGVRYLLEGSVRRSGVRARITAQLIEAERGSHVWSERFDCELTDIFEVQDQITAQVAGALEPQLLAAEARRLEQRSTHDLQAWECAMRALPHIWKFTLEETRVAQEWLSRALDRDPNYAYAHALMGWSHIKLWAVIRTDRQAEVVDVAEKYARTAALLDQQEPWVHLVFGVVETRRRKTQEAVAALTNALRLNPNFALAHAYLGFALGVGGQPEAGREALERALRLSPRDPFLMRDAITIRVLVEFAAGRYDEVVRLCLSAVQDRPNFTRAYRYAAASYSLLGKLDEAKAALARVLELDPAFTRSNVERVVVYSVPKYAHATSRGCAVGQSGSPAKPPRRSCRISERAHASERIPSSR